MLGEGHEGLEALNRYKSGGDFFKSFQEAQNKIRSGQAAQPATLGDDPTPEELATYRQENGIPQEAKGYLENLPDGLVLSEDDEARVNSFLDSAHGKNMNPADVHTMLDWYTNTFVPQEQEAQGQRDNENRAATIEELRGEWGGDYKANLNSALNFLETTAPNMEDGTSSKDLILGARLADGTLAGDNPHFLKWLANIAHEANPAGFIAPGSGLSNEQSIEQEISEIESKMGTKEYVDSEAMQARYRDLIDARNRMQARGAG